MKYPFIATQLLSEKINDPLAYTRKTWLPVCNIVHLTWGATFKSWCRADAPLQLLGTSLYSGFEKKKRGGMGVQNIQYCWVKLLITTCVWRLLRLWLCVYSARIYRVANSRCKSRCHATSWLDSWNISDSQPAITQILMVKWLIVGKKLSSFFNVLNFEDILFFLASNLTYFIAKLPVPSVSSVDLEGFMSGNYTNRMQSTWLEQEVINKTLLKFFVLVYRENTIYMSVCIHKPSCVAKWVASNPNNLQLKGEL